MAKAHTTEKKHAEYSPSSLYRIEACPRSVRETREQGAVSRDSAASKEGTRAHDLMERIFKKLDIVLEDYPVEMHSHIDGMVKAVRKEFKDGKYEQLLCEQKVDLTFIHDELYGTADLTLIRQYDTLHTIDLKYGRGYVNHVDNLQLQAYGLGEAHKYNYDFEDVKLSIYQPRYAGKAFRTDTMHILELKKVTDRLKRIIDTAESSDAYFSEGSHCHFCPVKFTCPKLNIDALAEAKLDFDHDVQPSPSQLSKEQLEIILDKASYLKLWLAEVEAYAHELLSSGKKLDGYGLVPKKATVQWADVDKLKKYIAKQGLQKYLLTTEVLTPAQARKALAKKFSDTDIKKFLDKNTVAISSGYNLKSTTNTALDFSLESESEDKND